MNIFEELRDRVPLEEVVGRFSEIRGNKARCVAPDHADDDPSMHVYEDHVHCFSCGFHGDVTDVWAATNGLDPESKLEVARDLAREYGVDLPEWSPEERARFERRRELEELHLREAGACHERLGENPQVVEWWEGRGFDSELRERFLLGAGEYGAEAVIPHWHRGRVRGLIRRKLRGEPKYLYPKAEDFAGGYRPLFIPRGRSPASACADLYLVEGPIDALAVAALGYGVAAVGGTGLSEQQRKDLARFPGSLYALPDADKAGISAGRVWAKTLYPKLRLCPAEYGEDLKDPADLCRERGGAAAQVLEGLKERATDALDLALSEAPAGNNRARYRYAREFVLPLLPKIEDAGERDAALLDAADVLKLKPAQLRKALAEIETPVEPEAEEQEDFLVEPEASPQEVRDLVGRPGVLSRYVEDAAGVQGVVGERQVLQLLALCAVGAQLSPLPNGRPAGTNVVLTAEAGRGKNYLADSVAALLPEEFCLPFESASAKALYYKAERNAGLLNHAWVYPNEAEAVDLLVEMFRPLISGGSAKHLTVNKDSDGRNTAQELNVEGPITVTIPTIRNKLDAQLQTRMLISELPDYPGRVANHSRAFSQLLLPDHAAEDHGSKVRAWRTALRQLTEVRRVVFPLDSEEFCFDSDQVSHGARLWGNLLGLMLAHAWLEQRNREVVELAGGERAVVATPEDYKAAYDVFEATCERSVVNLSDTHRKILDVVYDLNNQPGLAGGHSLRAIAEKANIHHSTVADNKTFLTKSVKLLYEVDGGGLDLVSGAEPSWWSKEDLLVGFPRPNQVSLWWEERFPGGKSTRQARQADRAGHDPHTHAENGVGHPIRQAPDTTRHRHDHAEVSGRESPVSGEDPDSKNGLGMPKTGPNELLAGVSGGFAAKRDTTSVPFDARVGEPATVPDLERRRKGGALSSGATVPEIRDALGRLFEGRPEAQDDSPSKIAEDLYVWAELDHVPPVEDVERALEVVV